jgi:DNA-binding PadR family transcriptional regulator
MPPQPSLGEFEQIVLLAVLRLGDHAYGVTILAEIAAHTGRNPSPGALYTTLHRMEDKGLITFRDGSPTPERGGRAKRFVTVTRPGRDALARAQSAYRNLLDGLDLLANPFTSLLRTAQNRVPRVSLLRHGNRATTARVPHPSRFCEGWDVIPRPVRVPHVSPLRHGSPATTARVPHPSQFHRDGWDVKRRPDRVPHVSLLRPGNRRLPHLSLLRHGYGATLA